MMMMKEFMDPNHYLYFESQPDSSFVHNIPWKIGGCEFYQWRLDCQIPTMPLITRITKNWTSNYFARWIEDNLCGHVDTHVIRNGK